MRISDWSSDVCSSDLSIISRSTAALPRTLQVRNGTASSCAALSTWRNRWDWMSLPRAWKASSNLHSSPAAAAIFIKARSEEHTSELQSLMRISYAVFCLKKKKKKKDTNTSEINTY